MSLRGLPDFYRPLSVNGNLLFYSYEGGEGYSLLPESIEIATKPDGYPDFSLEFVRGRNPLQPPAPYGLLDFRVMPHYCADEVLISLREYDSNASLLLANFSSGFLRFQPMAANLDSQLEELLKPIPLVWNGLGVARFNCKLSSATATLLKNSLQSEVLALKARTELEIVGVSPRLPLNVSFDPAQLLAALVVLGNSKYQIARSAISDYFRRDPEFLALKIDGEPNSYNVNEFAEAMTDRVRDRFGTFIPAPTLETGSYMALTAPKEIGSGRFEWDLREPVQVPRPFLLELDPFQAAQQLIQEQGLEAVVRETIVPPMTTGISSITIVTNLPTSLQGILALGVTLRVEPQLPSRPQALVETVELQDVRDLTRVNLRLSPKERLEYTFSTFVIFETDQGVQEFYGETKAHQDDRLYLNPNDFPVDFASVEAAHQLLAIAVIRGTCQWINGKSEIKQSFDLTLEKPIVTLVLPKGINATLDIEAYSLKDLGTIKLETMAARALHLNLYSFREYGAQKVEVECIFEENKDPVAFEFLPEGYPEKPEFIKLLFFQTNQPKKILTWAPRSLFQYRYRYRRKLSGNQAKASIEWSEYRSPFASLTVRSH
jgi:hypothetical protein